LIEIVSDFVGEPKILAMEVKAAVNYQAGADTGGKVQVRAQGEFGGQHQAVDGVLGLGPGNIYPIYRTIGLIDVGTGTLSPTIWERVIGIEARIIFIKIKPKAQVQPGFEFPGAQRQDGPHGDNRGKGSGGPGKITYVMAGLGAVRELLNLFLIVTTAASIKLIPKLSGPKQGFLEAHVDTYGAYAYEDA
jgi:hypothetical protein